MRVEQIFADSRACSSNSMFAALPGFESHGETHLTNAISNGATSLLTERPVREAKLPQCVVPNVRSAYSQICHALEGYPAKQLSICGVTGTNGKTTTAWLIQSILQAAGKQTGLLGTIEYSDGIQSEPASLTTPDAASLSRWMSRMVANGSTHLAMELSSHALDQMRMDGITLDSAVVTNITHDHLDYHKNLEDYIKAKSRILNYCANGSKVIVNKDDHGCTELVQKHPNQKFQTYSLTQDLNHADISADVIKQSLKGSQILLRVGQESVEIQTSLIGRFNVSNILAAVGATSQMGISLELIKSGIENLKAVPGRMERTIFEDMIHGFVDYAHTPDALEHAIQTLKPYTPGKLIVVFGAGGDRDQEKRQIMGRVSQSADHVILTNDNPRTEDPKQIINHILSGIRPGKNPIEVEFDREAAIQLAVQMANPGDTILIAGKGHETSQVIGSARIPFDDRDVLLRAFKTRSQTQQQFPKKISA